MQNVTSFGAVGDGESDDTEFLQAALDAAAAGYGCIFLPAGQYKITRPLTLNNCTGRISIRGDGDNVSEIVAHGGTGALNLHFEQVGQDQPFGLRLLDIGFRTVGPGGTAIRISYGNPIATTDHSQASTVFRNVSVISGPQGAWSNGIDIEAAWNVTMSDIYVSGDSAAGVWNKMSGAGIQFRRMCVNAHLVNVRSNFWAAGFRYDAAGGGNTEGLFFSNCSFVGVKRGVWITGNPSGAAPRVSTFVWNGGMVECRVAGVEGGSAAFHLQHVWTGLITGCQMLAETITENIENTYGVVAEDCGGIVVSACDLCAWIFGVATVGNCRAINVHGNTFTNVGHQVVFNSGTVQSRSYGNVCFNNDPVELDHAGTNSMGFVTSAA